MSIICKLETIRGNHQVDMAGLVVICLDLFRHFGHLTAPPPQSHLGVVLLPLCLRKECMSLASHFISSVVENAKGQAKEQSHQDI